MSRYISELDKLLGKLDAKTLEKLSGLREVAVERESYVSSDWITAETPLERRAREKHEQAVAAIKARWK